MYSSEKKKKAVELYILYHLSAAAVIREFGQLFETFIRISYLEYKVCYALLWYPIVLGVNEKRCNHWSTSWRHFHRTILR